MSSAIFIILADDYVIKFIVGARKEFFVMLFLIELKLHSRNSNLHFFNCKLLFYFFFVSQFDCLVEENQLVAHKCISFLINTV